MNIFCDLDGVLADFETSARVLTGITYEETARTYPPGPERWSWWRHKLSEADFWKLVEANPSFWPNLCKTAEADALLHACHDVAGDRVYLLTSPPLDPAAAGFKAAWVKRHYPQMYRRLFIGSRKEAFAHPGAVLVDDYDENVNRFREAGGKAVLVPRHWNTAHELEPEAVAVVHQTLTRIKEQMR